MALKRRAVKLLLVNSLVLMIFTVLLIDSSPNMFGNNYHASSALSSSSSDCDQQFSSLQRKSGTFASPDYPKPYQPDRMCKYTFQGQGRERVQILFTDLDLQLPADGLLTEPYDCEEADSITVTVTISGVPKDLGVFCGKKKPPMLMSHDNRMEVTFISRNVGTSSVDRGFKANYSFVTDFGIRSGVHDPNMVCGFTFRSNVTSNGTFTSPNFPGHYPRNTECHYLFYGGPADSIYITFPYFDVEGIQPGCSEDTQSDYVEFSNFNVELMDRKMSRFCGTKHEYSKKAVSSDGNFFRVTFKSNDVFDATGFEAHYQFRKIEDPFSNPKEKSSGAVLAVGVCFWVPLLIVLLNTQVYQTTMPSRRHRSDRSRDSC